MPATRPSTQVQRRAQPTSTRSTSRKAKSKSSKNRTPRVVSAQIPVVEPASEPVVEQAVAVADVERPSTSTASTSNHTAAPGVTLEQLATTVTQMQSVLASLQAKATATSNASREMPMVGSGIVGQGTADATMQGPVASALHNVSGEQLVHVSSPSPCLSNFNSVSMSIDAQVSTKLKSKIWANEYLDFGLLLNSQAGEARYNLSVSSQVGSSFPTLSLEPTHKTKPITNIEAWTTAFQIFVGVYTSKYPQEAPLLMKYGEVVRDLAARSADWRFYDTNFRQLRQTNPSAMSWGSTHWELWIRAQNFNGQSRLPKNQTARNNAVQFVPGLFVPKGFCRKFHRGSDCYGCNFKHNCFKCGVVHPANRCNFRPSRPSTSSPPAAKSRPTNPHTN